MFVTQFYHHKLSTKVTRCHLVFIWARVCTWVYDVDGQCSEFSEQAGFHASCMHERWSSIAAEIQLAGMKHTWPVLKSKSHLLFWGWGMHDGLTNLNVVFCQVFSEVILPLLEPNWTANSTSIQVSDPHWPVWCRETGTDSAGDVEDLVTAHTFSTTTSTQPRMNVF